MIRLYGTNYTNGLHLTSNGLVILQPFKCVETKSEEEWKLDVEVDDGYEIVKNQVIVVKTKEALYQPFRVGNVTLDKHTYSFEAYHIAYDLENYRIQSLTITNQGGSAFMNSLLGASLPANSYTPLSDIVATQSAVFENVSVLEALLETRNLFGGHLVFDNYDVKLQASIGSNRGVVIQEGKNLQGLSKTDNWDNVVTTIIPTCGDRVYSPINADVSYDVPYVKTVAFDSDEEDEFAIQADVVAQATAYLNINKYPRVNYVVKSDIVQLVQIGDTVTVKSDYTIGTTVMAYTYDIVKERVLSVEFGNYRPTIKSVFSGYAKVEDVKKNQATVNQIISDQTNIINGLYQSGYVVVNDNEIYIVDTLPKENAVNVLRMNLGGIGFSSNGISGPFGSAWTLDGKFNADYIQAGTINASLINGTAIDISANTSITSRVTADYVDAKILEVNNAKPNRVSNLETNWEQGTLVSGVDSASTSHIRTRSFYPISSGYVTVQCNDIFQAMVVIYDSSYNYISSQSWGSLVTFSLASSSFFKVVLRRTGGGTIATSEIATSELKVANEVTPTIWNMYYGDLTLEQQKQLYVFNVFSRSGSVFDSDTLLTLDAQVLLDNADVTSLFAPSQFRWTRYSKDSAKDTNFNNLGLDGATISITSTYLDRSATYQCEFTIVEVAYLLTFNGSRILTKASSSFIQAIQSEV